MNPPPNPHAAEAAAAMRAAIRPTLVNPPTDDAALLARAAVMWPDLGRYLAEMRLGIGLAIDSERGVIVPRRTVIVEVKGANQQ